MSRNNWPEYLFGLFLEEGPECADFRERWAKFADLNEKEVDLQEIADNIDYARYYDDEFDGTTFRPEEHHENAKEFVTGLFFEAEKQPTPFEAAYNSMEEVVSEFKDLIGQFLPEDFDYASHIGTFSGTIYC